MHIIKGQYFREPLNELKAKLIECKSSYQDVSNIFDQVEKQCITNTRNIIHFDSRITKLEEKPVVQPVIQPVVESEEFKSLKGSVVDLKCRSMKNKLIFTGMNIESKMKIQRIYCADSYIMNSKSIIEQNLGMFFDLKQGVETTEGPLQQLDLYTIVTSDLY